MAPPKSPAGPQTPTLQAYDEASRIAYQLTDNGKYNPGFKAPDGFEVVRRSLPAEIRNGFSAVALKDRSGNIIVAFEGTEPKNTDYGRGTLLDADRGILFGKTPAAFKDAIAFADEVHRDNPNAKLYVTGHSLGGAAAEAAAKALGDKVAGGTTFAAPGLPGNTDTASTKLTNYVDYADPIGTFGPDFQHVLPMHQNQRHFGKVVPIGKPGNASLRLEAEQHIKIGTEESVLTILDPAMAGMAAGNLKAGGTEFMAAVSKYHDLGNYETLLHIPKPSEKAMAEGTSVKPDPRALGAALAQAGVKQTAEKIVAQATQPALPNAQALPGQKATIVRAG